MRYFQSKKHFTAVLSNEFKIPIGFYVIMQEKEKQWGISIGCMRNSPKGTGKELLNDALKKSRELNIKKLTLMTAYDNFPMICCASKCGFKIIRRDNYGYEFNYDF